VESKSQSDSKGILRMILILGGCGEPVEVEVLHHVVSEPTIFVFCKKVRHRESGDLNSTWNGFETMSPGRCEDRPMPDLAMERKMREIHARLDTMETAQRRTIDVGDVSEVESENEAGTEEEVVAKDATEERLFKVVARIGARPNMDISMYEENLDIKELLDWFRALDKYFGYEDIEEDKKVKHVVTRLKGHATLWWDELQADRHCKGKKKIKHWDRMVAKMKVKFIPRDHQINLFQRMKNLRQKGMTVKEYTEDFYKINIRECHRENDDEKVTRYMNGLRYDIYDEMSMVMIINVEDYYKIALKAEEKLAQKQGQRGRGRSQSRGKVVSKDKVHKPKNEDKNPHTHPEGGVSS
jgi:hypothetical protein